MFIHADFHQYSVSSHTHTLSRREELLTLEREVREQGNVLSSLAVLGELREDKEPPPSTAVLAHADTLNPHGEGIQIALGDASGTNRPDGAKPAQNQQNKRDNDADGEHPARRRKGNGGLNLAGPAREGEKIDGGKGVDAIHGEGNEEENPQPEVGERAET